MNINRENYEVYCLDFLEGRLLPEQEEVLQLFLKQHPDLADEFDELRRCYQYDFIPEKIEFPGKEMLKKHFPSDSDIVSEANFDVYCIAYLENDLSEKQRGLFSKYLAEHPEMQSHYNACKSTYLSRESIPFPGKRRLKRSRKKTFYLRIFIPVAAAAALTIFFILPVPEPEIPLEIASVKVLKEKKENPREEDQQIKPASKPNTGNISVVKGSVVPVPASTFNKSEQEKEAEPVTGEEMHVTKPKQIAALNLQKSAVSLPKVQYDRLTPEIISPIAAKGNSLSIFDLARYRASKVAEAIDEDDAFIWSLASSGIQGLNRINSTETALLTTRDEDGTISGFRLKTRFLNVSAPLNRNEE